MVQADSEALQPPRVPPAPVAPANHPPKLSPQAIRHNMTVLIMMDAIFSMGVSDLAIATGPLWKYLGASNALIGQVSSLSMLGLIGAFASPFISVRLPIKKWYLFIAHLPYIGTWGLIGLLLILGHRLEWSIASLLAVVIVLNGANFFFGGFVSLPHQEYTAACIPMSHRARFTGFSLSIGSILGFVSSWIGGLVLLRVAAPESYGWLFIMMWGIAQAGYCLALVGRELPTPVERAPRPWSLAMLRNFWNDKPFMIVLLNSLLSIVLFTPVFNIFLTQYGLRETGMRDAGAAVLVMITQGVRILLAAPIGQFIDRFTPKRTFSWALVFGACSYAPALLIHGAWGVYLSMGLMTAFMVAQNAITWALLYGIPKPEDRAGHYSIQLLATSATMAVGGVLVGRLCDLLNYHLTFLILAAAALLLALFAKFSLASLSARAEDYA